MTDSQIMLMLGAIFIAGSLDTPETKTLFGWIGIVFMGCWVFI